ncbi:hypothetical protein LL266_16795 [Vibrio anguillarum]|uniref:hypothetical protein n=1 Tax=Vibrio anguillarum TaxID=55601 RepID=UPI001D18000E|nr:hypothetical protein [Vibrio anguillarum]MCC4238149.1 hypothetical protein [Vibrio anguillarum]
MSEKNTSKRKPLGKAVKVSADSYELVVAEALRLGVQRGEIVTIQQVIDELIQAHLSGKPKPELKE